MPDDEGVIVYSTKEILTEINEKLSKATAAHEALDRRVVDIDTRVTRHDRLLNDELPKITKFMEKMDVRSQVEEALDSRKVHGVSNRDRVIVGALSACILIVSILSYLPHVIGG